MYRFDFLPAGRRDGALGTGKHPVSLGVACLAAFLVAAAAYCVFLHQLAALKHREAAARVELEANRGERVLLEQVKEKRAQKELARQELEAFAKAAVPCSPTLSQLEAAVPPESRLVRVELAAASSKGEDGRPAGRPELAVEGYAPDLSSAGKLAAALKRAERVLDVEVGEVRSDAATGAYHFKITARLAGGED